MAGQETASTLNLSTLSGGMPITIDGVRHQIRHPESLPLHSYKELETKLPRLGHLMVKDSLTKPQKDECRKLLAEVVDVVLDAPDAVRGKLKDVQRVLILDVFMKLQPTSLPTTPAAATTARRRTGGKSSRH